MSKERRLGRGLEALLGRPGDELEGAQGQGPQGGAPAAAPAAAAESGLAWIDVDQIDRNPYQPRCDFEPAALEELRQSIETHGLLQPLVVRRAEDRFQLIAGERRLRAVKAAGWAQVAVQIRDVDDRQLAELAIVENIQRKDLNPLEKAASFQRYLQQYQCTQEELARRVKIDRSTIANLIRLLELPETVQQALRAGAITMGHARALLPLGDEREQLAFCKRIREESLTVRDTEEQVQALIRQADAEPLGLFPPDGHGPPRRRPATRSEHLLLLEQELRTALGTKVDLRQTLRGRGRIVIHFKTHDEFQRIRQHLTGPQRLEQSG